MFYFGKYVYILYAFLATLFTFGVTAFGSLIVFLFKKVNQDILDISNALAAGVMIAASFYSLLNPAYDLALNLGMIPWLNISLGFLFGGIFLFLGDIFLNKYTLHKNIKKNKKSLMLIISITLHNIPEGLAVGVAFGSIIYNIPGASLVSALVLALGIGIQNFPEGALVSLPLRGNGMSRKKAFIIGSLTALPEPIAGVIGAFLVTKVRIILPILLSFAAGAMIYVALGELIPDCEKNKNKDFITLLIILGFILMMILDVIFS